jgi:hypothetical protein
MALDDDSTPLWRGHGALFLDDIMILELEDVAHVMDDIALEDDVTLA